MPILQSILRRFCCEKHQSGERSSRQTLLIKMGFDKNFYAANIRCVHTIPL